MPFFFGFTRKPKGKPQFWVSSKKIHTHVWIQSAFDSDGTKGVTQMSAGDRYGIEHLPETKGKNVHL